MSVEFTQIHDWGIVPTKSNCCFDLKCLDVKNPRPLTLFPDRINHIPLGFQIHVPPGNILQIKSHLSYKPWKVIHEYLTTESYLTQAHLSIITPVEFRLKAGDILAHIQVQRLTGVLTSIEGKAFFFIF
jgi:hypothetical protein